MGIRSWRQCNDCGKLIPIAEWEDHIGGTTKKGSAYVHGDIETFKSPIDGSIISDRAQLREHNRKHGVTDMRDYSPEYIKARAEQRERAMVGQDRQGRRERIETIIRAIEQHGG